MAFGTTPISTTPLGTNQFPVSAVAVPNASGGNLTALEGGPASTDTNGNSTAPVSVYIKDGGNIVLGTTTDSAGTNSVLGQLKQIRVNTTSITIGSALPAGNNVIGVISFGGTTAQYVPANSGVVSVKTGTSRLASVIVIGTGTTQLNFYDNVSQASGTPIGAVPANAAVGSVYAFNSPAQQGIVANSVANCCSVTICYY